MPLTLEFIVHAITGVHLPGQTPVSTVVHDSRSVEPGGLFIALPGENVDGHDFVPDAFQRGAVAALIDHEVPDVTATVIDLTDTASLAERSDPLPVPVLLKADDALLATQEAARQWVREFDTRIIGITGSVGKTTTKEVIASLFERQFSVLKSQASYNNEIGIPLTVLNLQAHHEYAVLEMSMYTIDEIALLTSIAPPDVGVVTLIAPVHLERAGSMENIIRAKTELVEALPPAPDGVAVLNYDDENVMSMVDHTDARIVTYGLSQEADVWANQIEGLGLNGIRFWIHSHGAFAEHSRRIHLPMLGRHSVHTALRAAAVGLVEGMGWDAITEGLRETQNQLRLIVEKGPNGSMVLDDTYNASPSSTIAALNLLNDIMEGRRIAVLGDMLELGSYEEEGHKRVGRRAAAVADLLVTVGELGRIIGQEAIHGGMPSGSVSMVATAEEAVEVLLGELRSGDALLVKGSRAVGMERIVRALTEQAQSGVGDQSA